MPNIKRNLLYQISYEVLILIIPLILSPYVARVLGADRIGIYSFTFTMANYFVVFANLGIKNYGNREIARNRDDQDALNRTFSSIFLLHVLLSLLVVIGYIVYIFTSNANNRLYVIISGLYVVGALFDISWLFFGLEQFKLTVIRNGIIRIISIICVFLFVKSQDDLWIYILILTVSNLLGQVYLWRYAGRYVKFVKVSLADTFHHLPEMSILFIPTIAISLYNYMDKIMVGAISGSQQLGFYEMAEKIPAIAIAVMGSVGTVMMPRMSNLVAKGDYEKGKKYINTSMQFVMWLSIAMAFGIAGVAKVFAPVYWGIAFSQCAEILMLLVIILPIKGFANVVRTQYLIPSKKDRQYVISVVSGAAVNLVVNFLLIPSLQSIGAALGTIAAEFTVCFVQAYACRKELPIIDYVKSSFPFLIIGAGMCFAVSLIGANHANTIGTLLLQIICGGALYVLLTGIWLYATKNVLLINILKAWKRKD